MTDHDPLCQFGNPIPGVELTCTCPALRLARADQDKKSRADERERIAQEIEAERDRHWQERRTDAKGWTTPHDYGKHDAYHRAIRIARGEQSDD